MKHKQFLLLFIAMLSLASTTVGCLALLGLANAEVYFWTRSPIKSDEGKIAWIVISTLCFFVCLILIIRDRKKK